MRIRSQDYLNHKITLSLETFETVLPLVLEDIIERHQQTILEIVGLLDDPVQIDLLTIQIEADILSRFDPQLNGLINNMAVFLIDIDKELTTLLSTPTSRLSPMQQEKLKLLELWNKTLQKKKFIESPYEDNCAIVNSPTHPIIVNSDPGTKPHVMLIVFSIPGTHIEMVLN